VRAVDADLGVNGQVTYGLASQTQLLHGHLFEVDAKSGNLCVTGIVDREASAVIQLIVTAQDSGMVMFSNATFLYINPAATSHLVTWFHRDASW